MAAEDPSPRPTAPRRYTRLPSTRPPGGRPNRFAFRLIGIPVLAVAGVLLYRGVRDYFYLPDCDSTRAKNTLADIFKQLKIQPLNYDALKTISSNKSEVVCNGVFPLGDGSSVNVDYRFFWQGSTAEMRYSISHRPGDQLGTGTVKLQSIAPKYLAIAAEISVLCARCTERIKQRFD